MYRRHTTALMLSSQRTALLHLFSCPIISVNSLIGRHHTDVPQLCPPRCPEAVPRGGAPPLGGSSFYIQSPAGEHHRSPGARPGHRDRGTATEVRRPGHGDRGTATEVRRLRYGGRGSATGAPRPRYGGRGSATGARRPGLCGRYSAAGGPCPVGMGARPPDAVPEAALLSISFNQPETPKELWLSLSPSPSL